MEHIHRILSCRVKLEKVNAVIRYYSHLEFSTADFENCRMRKAVEGNLRAREIQSKVFTRVGIM